MQNWENRTLYHGDNLTFLRAMNSESIDLIATDPPFNKGRDFHATPDSLAAGAKFQDRWSWERDVHPEWVDQLTDDCKPLMEAIESARYAHSDGMGAFMCFMAVRLLETRRVLRATGSIYLHCDPTASHYLKAVMDAVFGYRNFRNEIVWKRTSSRNDAKRWGGVHDTILFYSNGPTFTWNPVYLTHDPAYIDKFYRNEDERGRWMSDVIERSQSMGPRPNLSYEFDGYTPKWGWRMKREKLEVLARDGRIIWSRNGKPRLKRYLHEQTGPPILDVVTDIQLVSPHAKERLGYPTQKPLALYERIIRASSNEGDIILDPFCGCATTLVAAERVNRQWVGMDIWERAHEVVVDRLRREVGLFGEVHFASEPPERTDEGDDAAPFLRVKERIREPEGKNMSRAEMYEFLLTQHGPRCQGCDRIFDDPRYLELDHNTPRSDGGMNHITNRILLCGPCNRLKSNTYTLSGLRRENKKRCFMAQGRKS